jgi:hypothetical protein
MDPGKIQNGGDLPNPVIARHDLIETERIEEPPLILIKPSHHRQSPPLIRTKTTESPFNDGRNRLLQQNRHIADIPAI